jgi:hypothetical protein
MLFCFTFGCSGMLVQDPTKGNEVDAIFNQARQVAIEGPADHLRSSSSSKSFTGTARLLSGETVSSAPQHPEAVNHTITFWSNGFSVDDGPLRRFDDPENASFLEVIFNEVPFIVLMAINLNILCCIFVFVLSWFNPAFPVYMSFPGVFSLKGFYLFNKI